MDFSDLKKLERAPIQNAVEGERVTAIVRVKQPGYRPTGVRVRSELDACLFTAELPVESLKDLEADARVESVAIAQRLPLQKLPG